MQQIIGTQQAFEMKDEYNYCNVYNHKTLKLQKGEIKREPISMRVFEINKLICNPILNTCSIACK